MTPVGQASRVLQQLKGLGVQDIYVLAIGAGAGAAVLVALLLLQVTRRKPRTAVMLEHGPPDTVILLRDGTVIDHTEDVVHLFSRSDINGLSWTEIRTELASGFPDLPEDPPTETSSWPCILIPEARLDAQPTGRSLRLAMHVPPMGAALVYRSASVEEEYERLEAICDNTPDPVFQTDAEGRVIWHNDAYEDLCRDARHADLMDNPFDLPAALGRSSNVSRVSMQIADAPPRWFEITSSPMGDGWVHFASSIDNLVNAEMAQRNFVQTLTKTFAHLPIGLAVFDKSRQLVLFNPALVDLTHLPVDFLSAKPNLLSFFDHMRENRMMPEPKNYANWRDKLYDVVSAAREDRYAETWNLPSGLTYKITGRPHPDGAVAFLIEDISAEISLTRRFRSELELTQSVLDCLDDAVAVFSRLGVLTFSNAAYRERWKCDPDSAFAEVTIVDATKDWRDGCEPSPIWAELREFVLTLRDRSTWDADLVTRQGEELSCIIEPVAAGATMVRFTRRIPQAQADAPIARKAAALKNS